MWGLRPDEVIGRPFFSIDSGLPTEPLRQAARTCMVTGPRAEAVELDAINRLGHGIACTVTATPMADSAIPGITLLVQEGGRRPRADRERGD